MTEYLALDAVSRKILRIIGQDSSVSKSNRLHVDNFQLFFIDERKVDCSKLIGNLPKVLNLSRLFVTLNRLICD